MPSSTRLLSLFLAGLLINGFAATWFSTAQGKPRMIIAGGQTGKVTYVADGDSIYIGNWEIRLAAIDAPERDQPYGRQARRALSELIRGRVVRIESVATDDYGRTVAHVYRVDDGLHVNAAMVARGAAWVYHRYTRDRSLMALQSAAKRGNKGLWALPSGARIMPEQWRREHETRGGAFDCAVDKTRCKQMHSCEEARFYFTRCRAHWLDGDKDGVPCDPLCRRR